MEEMPKIRVVGSASQENKDARVKEMRIRRFEHDTLRGISKEDSEMIRKFESDGTRKQMAMTKTANRLSSALMVEAGVEPFEVHLDKIHILPSDIYGKITDRGDGMFSARAQEIFLNEGAIGESPVFGSSVFHELLHFKGHYTLGVNESGKRVSSGAYRSGVAVRPENKPDHFNGLNEAIVAELEKRMFVRLVEETPELEQERATLRSEAETKKREGIAKEREISEDEIIWVDGNQPLTFGYRAQRQVLSYVCAELSKQFPETYRSGDDVFKVFQKAHFTGNLLGIGRLVEKTFGPGGFRMLGNMNTDKESGELHLESLQKARLRVQKNIGEGK